MATEGRDSVGCNICDWRIRVPRQGTGQPFDAAMAFHEVQMNHFNFTFPIEDMDGSEVISEAALAMGAAYMLGARRGAEQERSRIKSLINDGKK